jgi:hypothetical protein
MKSAFVFLLNVTMIGVALLVGSPARAGGSCTAMAMVCENGHRYPIGPLRRHRLGQPHDRAFEAIFEARLVPMGVGYRYIGPGLCFDGDGQHTTLNFGAHRSLACTVAQN